MTATTTPPTYKPTMDSIDDRRARTSARRERSSAKKKQSNNNRLRGAVRKQQQQQQSTADPRGRLRRTTPTGKVRNALASTRKDKTRASNARASVRGEREEGEVADERDDDVFDLSAERVGSGAGAGAARGAMRETDPHKLKQRQRQIDYGKNTLGYARYLELVKKSERRASDVRTPDIHAAMSKRAFDGIVKKWRRALHAYDPVIEDGDDEAMVAVPVDPTTRPDGKLNPGEYVPVELAEAAARRERAKAEAEAAVRENRRLPVERLPALRAAPTPSTLPTHEDMSPGWDAITPTPYKRDGQAAASRFSDTKIPFPSVTPAAAAQRDADMMDCDDASHAARSIYDDWEGADFAGVV
jgi:histone RNA hairpin-binding protein